MSRCEEAPLSSSDTKRGESESEWMKKRWGSE